MSRSKRRGKQRSRPLFHLEKPSGKAEPARERKSNESWLPPAVAIVLVLAGGVVYGLQTNRWVPSHEVEEAAARLQNVPLNFGDWKGEDQDVSLDELEQAGAVGHLHRVYRNSKSGEAVSVMILCGPHGPISLHPPTVCFTGAGWVEEEQPEPTSVNDNGKKHSFGSFFVARFRKSTATSAARMRTCWAWNADGSWESPDGPRYAFAGAGHLYKIYVTTALPADTGGRSPKDQEQREAFEKGPCVKFIRDFIPVLQKSGI